MSAIQPFPNFESLFGELDFKKGEVARSVHSPAAYLADLIQLIEDNFQPGECDLKERRPDIWDLTLDEENTFELLPYLSIVNTLLENMALTKANDIHAGEPGYPLATVEELYTTELKAMRAAFETPFDLEHEQRKKYLSYAKVAAERLYKTFVLSADNTIVAREKLGLSADMADALTTPAAVVDKAFFESNFNYNPFDPADPTDNSIEQFPISDFLTITDISGQSLRELLFQNLGKTAVKSGSDDTEQIDLPKAFFINHNVDPTNGGYACLDGDENFIIWSVPGNAIPNIWFDRVNRFLRLAKRLNLSFTDLDLILRSCCGNQINNESLQIVAVVLDIHQRTETPIDTICSLLSNMNVMGLGDEDEPLDLFNRVFNAAYTPIDKKYILSGTYESIY